MQLILNNPYRILGLLVGATAREQDRQIKRLRQFVEAEQDFQEGYSFSVLGELNRNIDNINLAASKLNLNTDKMNAALFWFFKGYEITDEPAFDSLQEGDYKNTIEIWKKLATAEEVTERNSSAFQNLSTLYIACAFMGAQVNKSYLEQGIALKLKFLGSEFVIDFKRHATDETYKTTKKELQLSFLKQLHTEISKNDSINPFDLIQIINKLTFSAKEDILKILVCQPIVEIEKKIEETKEKRKINRSIAAVLAKSLFNQTFESLSQLKSILGEDNIAFSSISDKLSQEILQCGNDFFEHNKDSDTDPGSVSMALFQKARAIAIGSIAIQECQESIDILQKWIDEKPERDKLKRTKDDFEKLRDIIGEYEAGVKTIEQAGKLLSISRPYLKNLEVILENSDELYLGLSTRVADIALGMCVEEVNSLLDKIKMPLDNATRVRFAVLQKVSILKAWIVTATINRMDLQEEFRHHSQSQLLTLSKLTVEQNISDRNKKFGREFSKHLPDISALMAELSVFEKKNISQNEFSRYQPDISDVINKTINYYSHSSSNEWCFIATMVYGSYNHPQVLVLRKFRDEVLGKILLGKWFIKLYYRYSPKLVDKLKNKRTINLIIRKILDLIINIIK